MATTYSTPKPDLRPPLPTPNIPLLLTRFGESAAPFVSAALLAAYKGAITTLFSPDQTQHILDLLQEKATNWSNAWFLKLLLSTRFAVATTSRLSILINVPEASRERKLAGLLRAVGVWSLEYVFSNGSSRYTTAQQLLEWQLRGLCGAFRVPKKPDTCMLEYVGPEKARHVVIWCGGVAWTVQVVDEQGAVFSADEIEQQITGILKARVERQSNISVIPRIAALSWRLDRPAWHLRKAALELIPENSVPLSTLYTSLVTVALEEYPAPADISARLDDVRMGETSENRFADQTFGIVSYSDGEMGLTFDHAPADCGAAMELSMILLDPGTSPISGATAPTNLKPLQFFTPPQAPDIWQLPKYLIEPIPRTVITVNTTPLTPGTPRTHVTHRLCDTVVNLAIQAALYRTAGSVAPISQPVQLKKFHMSRCDSMISVSNESLAFIKLVFDENANTQSLHTTLSAAIKRRKEIINNTLDGTTTKYFRQGYIHPALTRMAKDPPNEGLQAVLDVFQIVSGRVVEGGDPAPSTLQFTGFTAPTDGVVAGLSNVFLPNQLVVFYLQRPNGTLATSFSATGTYRPNLEAIVRSYQESYEIIAGIADRYVQRPATVTPTATP